VGHDKSGVGPEKGNQVHSTVKIGKNPAHGESTCLIISIDLIDFTCRTPFSPYSPSHVPEVGFDEVLLFVRLLT
jgi:hypothetical protein